MCYAISTSSDPMGSYHRYEFLRPLFPDYPRPAVWPDGYYVPTSTGDDVIQKHACVVDRAAMLRGEPATEQCVVVAVGRLSRMDTLQGQALARDLQDREQARLALLQEALRRVAAGTYGWCLACSGPIPFARLLVFAESPECGACPPR